MKFEIDFQPRNWDKEGVVLDLLSFDIGSFIDIEYDFGIRIIILGIDLKFLFKKNKTLDNEK